MKARDWFARFPNLMPQFVVAVVLNVASGLLMIWQAVLLASLVTHVFLLGEGIRDLATPLTDLFIVMVLRAVTSGLSEHAITRMSVRTREDLRMTFVRKLFQLGPVYLRTEKAGELINAAMTGVEQIDVYVSKYLPQVVHAFFIPLSVWCLVAGTDVFAAVILALTAPLIPFFMILIGKGAQAVSKRQWQSLSVLGGHFLDVIRGLTTLKVFNRSRAQIEIIRHVTDDYREATMRSLRIAFLSALVLELLTTLSTAIVAVMLGLRLLDGNIDFHRAFLILLLAPEFYQPMRMIGTQFHASMNGIEAAKRIFAILDSEESIGSEAPVTLDRGPVTVEFDDVSFSYRGATEPVLSHVSFRVRPGQKVALVGASGAGKSSIFDLLLGFVAPSSGRILINGVDLQQIHPASLRRQIAYVPQHPHLFPSSILENIRLARPLASAKDVQRAARLAQVDSFIRALDQSYDTPVSEELNLSGGQAGRIAMARAILKDAPLVCLDEPTSGLDVQNEYEVQKSLDAVLHEKTAIIAAHRVRTIVQAHLIVVLVSGRVVETGTHQSLMDLGGVYAAEYQAAVVDSHLPDSSPGSQTPLHSSTSLGKVRV